MKRRIVVVGSVNMDMTVHAERFPKGGETLLGNGFTSGGGGKGANQAVAAAKLGGDVAFVGAVGADAEGSALRASLDMYGVDTKYLKTLDGCPSGVALITVDGRGENTIIVAPGANGEICAAQACAAINEVKPAVVCCQLEIPMESVKAALAAAREAGAFTLLNPAPAPADGLEGEMLALCSLVAPNEHEAQLLSGIATDSDAGVERAAQRLLERGAGAVIITLGGRGSYYRAAHESFFVPAVPTSVVDTTGAGDSFIGAVCCALAEGKTISEAMRMASVVGALTVSKAGAQRSMPTKEELQAYLS